MEWGMGLGIMEQVMGYRQGEFGMRKGEWEIGNEFWRIGNRDWGDFIDYPSFRVEQILFF